MAKLLSDNNVNKSVFVIPCEQGGTEDDTACASIGDATQKHIANLSDAERVLWEDLIISRGGQIFRSVPNPNYIDNDPYNLSTQDLDIYEEEMKKQLNSDEFNVLQEVIQEERERRLKSEDVYDHSDLMSFEDLQDNPGMMKHIDLPKVPRDILHYLGNTTQVFYDEFPEYHSESNTLNLFLNMLNRDENEFTTQYAQYLHKKFIDVHFRDQKLVEITHKLVNYILAEPHRANEFVAAALNKIDEIYGKNYRTIALTKSYSDPVHQLLTVKEKEWQESSREGKDVYNSIKEFGGLLFNRFRKYMTPGHWVRYKRIKTSYVPAIYYRGVNINSCRLSDLIKTLKLTRNQAIKLWHARPFETLEQAHNRGFLELSKLCVSEEAQKLVSLLEQVAEQAQQEKSLLSLSNFQKQVTTLQSSNKVSLDNDDWRTFWSYYRTTKTRLLEDLQASK